MKYSFTLAASLLASTAFAAPVQKRQAGVTDADILQFALTLEHLENVFYKGGISTYPESEFIAAGFSQDFYNNLKFVVHDEEQHVELLTSALAAAGASPVAACTYDFPYTDVFSFVALASVLEGVGTSAYLGAAPLISSKAYLGVAGAILVTEALHTSLERFNIGEVAPANPYATALGLNEVFTLAASFIVSCPSTNAALPVKAFPALTATQGEPTSIGITFTFTTATPPSGTFFVTFFSGLSTTSVPATYANGVITTTIPDTASGQTYAVLTSTNVTGTLSDADVLAGPAILEVTPSSPTFTLSIQ
ncbi:MAG: hypothetical protein MMC33_009643 [Icmadophila ericetorum]|nr:hypothetical protein [Icmadophila ericetorum]